MTLLDQLRILILSRVPPEYFLAEDQERAAAPELPGERTEINPESKGPEIEATKQSTKVAR